MVREADSTVAVPVEALGLREGNGKKSERRFSQEQFLNAGEYAEWKIRVGLGIYPPDHIVSRYAQQALQAVGGPPESKKPLVKVYKGPANAFIFPNGSVYVSDQLIQLVDNKEQLLFILGHERIHYLETHAQKVQERLEDPELAFRAKLLGMFGQDGYMNGKAI